MPPIGKYSVPLQNYIGFLVFVHFDVGKCRGATAHDRRCLCRGELRSPVGFCGANLRANTVRPYTQTPVFTAKQQDRKKDHILDNVVHCFHTHWQI